MFIKLNEKNEIVASATFQVDDSFIETNKNIVRALNGRLYFEDEKPDDSIYKKEMKIKALKTKYSNEIYDLYPISKQLDIIARIGGYTDDDFNNMKNYIESKILEYKKEKEKCNE